MENAGIDELQAQSATAEQVSQSLARGVAFLKAQQDEAGGYESFVARSIDMQSSPSSERSVFATVIVLRCLKSVQGSAVEDIRRAGKGFLLDEMLPGVVWRYYSSQSQDMIAPDLDDTACCLKLLAGTLAQPLWTKGFVNLLANRDERGLFKTWIVPKGQHNDVDAVVNANIVSLVGHGKETGAAIDYLIDCIQSGRESSSVIYYVADAALYHALALAIESGVKPLAVVRDPIIDRIAASDPCGSVLESALACCASLSLGRQPSDWAQRSISFLLDRQRQDGSWPMEAFYCGPDEPVPRSYWFGCEAMTTAHCVEALARYLDVS